MLHRWTQQKYDLSDATYNFIYLLGAIGFSLFTFTNGICWAQVGMLTAKNIHAELLKSVLAARMEFFDTTPVIATLSFDACPERSSNLRLRLICAPVSVFFPLEQVGRMISRFAKDMQAVDDNIPMQFDMCVRVVIILTLNFCVIGYITPAFMVVVAPIMVL